MSSLSLIEKDLPEILKVFVQFSDLTPEMRRKKRGAMISKLEDLFENLEEYMKKLPNAESHAACCNRIVIFNCRNIFKALSVVFDLEIQFLTKKYMTVIREKERAIEVQDTSTGEITLKPKKRKVRDKDHFMEFNDLKIRGNIFPTYSNVMGIAVGCDVLWTADVPFDDTDQLRTDIPPREPEIPADADIDIQMQRESFPAPVMESTVLDPRISSVLGPLRISHPPTHVEPLEIDLVRDDLRPAETVQSKNVSEVRELEHINLMNEIEDIVAKTSPRRSQHEKKNVCLKFVEKPVMDKETYTKFLKYKTKDPVKLYTQWGDSVDKYFQAPCEEELIEAVLFQHDYEDHIEKPKSMMPVPVIPFYLRDTVISLPLEDIRDAPIAEFEFPPRMIEYHEVSGKERQMDSLYGEHLRGDLDTSARLARISQTGRDIPIGHETVEGDVLLPHPNDVLNLELTDVNIEALLPGEKSTIGDPGQEFPELVMHTPSQSKFSSDKFQEEVEYNLRKLCSERENFTIKFTDLCSSSESRLVASKVFLCVLGLWSLNKIEMLQISDSPDDIFVTLNRQED